MAWGEDFLQGFFGGQGFKDYAHASKTFLTNGYQYAPRNKFLFHCYFNINTSINPMLAQVFNSTEKATIGLMVKSIQLPKYTIDTETLNQYNRKRVVQKKLNYSPVQVVFHDDGGDLTRSLWYYYYSYYYKDPTQAYGPPAFNGSIGEMQSLPGFSYNSRDIYARDRVVNDWGYIGESYSQGSAGGPGTNSGGDQSTGKPPFFRDIMIYGMDQRRFAAYTLINPIIKSWDHDTYSYSEGGTPMQNSMTIEYETVKYYGGALGGVRPDTNVMGFGDPAYYDNVKSSLARPGSTQTVLGQGGLLDAGIGIVQDLTSGKGLTGIIGAVQKAGTAYNTFKGVDFKSVANEEANAALKTVLKNGVPSVLRQIPNSSGGKFFPVNTTPLNLTIPGDRGYNAPVTTTTPGGKQ